jgi:hypothetical protein
MIVKRRPQHRAFSWQDGTEVWAQDGAGLWTQSAYNDIGLSSNGAGRLLTVVRSDGLITVAQIASASGEALGSVRPPGDPAPGSNHINASVDAHGNLAVVTWWDPGLPAGSRARVGLLSLDPFEWIWAESHDGLSITAGALLHQTV